MKRCYQVKEGGRLEGLLAVGFHGEVDPTQTPGRREAILADETGHLIGLEGRGSDASEFDTQAVWGQVGARVETGSLPGVSTLLKPTLPAYRDHIVVVLGRAERDHAAALAKEEPPVDAPQASALLQWLLQPESVPPSGLMVQHREAAVLWYCGVADAFALYQRICRVAEKEMVRASNEGNDKALYQASWWLARASLDDSDRYFAAVGLERSNRSIADAYLKATFRRRPAEEIEAALLHARGVLDDRRMDAKRRQMSANLVGNSSGPKMAAPRGDALDIGATLFGSRARMRARYIIPQRRAA